MTAIRELGDALRLTLEADGLTDGFNLGASGRDETEASRRDAPRYPHDAGRPRHAPELSPIRGGPLIHAHEVSLFNPVHEEDP